MIWDPCLARAVAGELEDRLRGCRARSVLFDRQLPRLTVYFRDETLSADLSPGCGAVTVGPAREPEPDAEPLPAVLRSVEAVPDERTLVLRFRRVRGRKPNPALVLELVTNRWNGMLAEGPELRVRKRLRALAGRSAPVGQPWLPPAQSSRLGTGGGLELDEWVRLCGTLWKTPRGPSTEDGRRSLLWQIAYTSAINAPYLLGAPDPEEGFRRWRIMAEMKEKAPALLRLSGGQQPYPWPLDQVVTARATASLLAGMDEVLAQARLRRPDGGSSVSRHLAGENRRLARQLKHLRAQLKKTGRAGRLRQDGSLILASLCAIPAGTERAVLTDFDGTERVLRLDPALRPQDHANALFRRAARLERGALVLEKRIAETEAVLKQVGSLRRRHERGDLSRDELAAVIPSRDLRTGKTARTGAAPNPAPLPYRTYRSSGGLEIRVAQNAKKNDELTFRHSRPNDIWLHARHAAGAHVILRWVRPERPPATDLKEAAVLAANNSKARGAGHVPVDWTRRKWVRKPRGAPAGAVIPERVQTVFVSPDPPLS